MIAKLTGQIVHRAPSWIVLETNGIGYKVFTGTQKFKKGEKTELFIHHYIKEDRSDLYGFSSLEELELFELLLMVPGVGPKLAQAILCQVGADKLQEALTAGQVELLGTVAGVGKKLAQKIVVELKPRVAEGGLELSSLEEESEVVEALRALGYKQAEIGRVLRQLPADLTETSQKLRWCLRHLGKSRS